MAVYFFDVRRNDIEEPDGVGTELSNLELVPQMALSLALAVAKEALPQMMRVVVSVRDRGTGQLYEASLSLVGNWNV